MDSCSNLQGKFDPENCELFSPSMMNCQKKTRKSLLEPCLQASYLSAVTPFSFHADSPDIDKEEFFFL
jgi:hypothetical protein